MIDQPLIETRRTAGETRGREQQERSSGQHRQENPDHPQRYAQPADGQQYVAQHQGAVAYGVVHRQDLSGDEA
ncbi:hypothetical protein D3C87_1857250 [compost metagenome]